jgi:hypothetical protein
MENILMLPEGGLDFKEKRPRIANSVIIKKG